MKLLIILTLSVMSLSLFAEEGQVGQKNTDCIANNQTSLPKVVNQGSASTEVPTPAVLGI